ncbi:hypothetical protein ACFVU3_03235 [Streptomyces sp. NPDC058052]|uniref:hypothetical protein n=1 Tax=Streptomyces sp. NPDC058052 TaxID=3346316 RepID=UPI0036E34D4F
MVAWERMRDCWFECDRVPVLLERVERDDAADAWDELGWRLVLEHDLVSPASFAALPRLVRLAPRSARARALAGKILGRAAGHHGCDDLFAEHAGAVAEFREFLDRHLRSRPADYLVSFRALLAAEGEYHWAAVLDDFTDDFFPLDCPGCGARVTIAIGDHGRYSEVPGMDPDDAGRRGLRPAVPEDLVRTGRRMHEAAVRDGQAALADGILALFGQAECPACAAVFSVSDEYGAGHRPVMG